MSDRQYSKVYHVLADEYPDIFDGPDLAAYVRLLVAANQAWPTAARWPGYATKLEVQRLADVGLVLLDGQRFRIKGLDKERSARSDAASHAARTRYRNAGRNADRTADGNAERLPSRVEQRRVEQSSSADGIFDAYYHLTARPPSQSVIKWLNQLTDEHGDRTVTTALAEEHKADPDPSSLLGRVQTRLADQARREAKAAEERRKRGAIEELNELQQKLAAASPEEQARAAAVREQVGALVKGMPG